MSGDKLMETGIFVDLNEAGLAKALQNSRVSVIDFWAPWCRPCKAMGAVLDRVAPEFAGKISFFKVNVDAEPSLASRFGITAIPTLLAFKGPALLGRFEGKIADRDVVTWLESLLNG